MDDIVTELLEAGYPIAMHAIGDTAVSIGLSAFEKAAENGIDLRRPRMEHVRVVRPDLIDRMADLGISASIQYTWARTGVAPFFELLVLAESLDDFFPWRRIYDKGIPII